MKKNRLPRRALLVALTAVLGLAVAVTGYAAVTIYDNDFKSRHEFKNVRKAAGGKACDRSWHKRKAFKIAIDERRVECAYEPPVYSDGPGGDLSVKAVFKVLSENTTSKIRRGAYALLEMRASKSARYQLRFFPKSGRWELRRAPNSDEFPVKGKIETAGLDKRNKILMRTIDDTIDIWINGKRAVKGKADPAAAEVGGRAVRVGLGQRKKAKRPTTGLVNALRIDLPNP